MNFNDSLPIACLATGVMLLAAEVRRMGRERDSARHEFEGLVARLAERPTTVLTPIPESKVFPVEEALYISELPYHDDEWAEFVGANEVADEPEDE